MNNKQEVKMRRVSLFSIYCELRKVCKAYSVSDDSCFAGLAALKQYADTGIEVRASKEGDDKIAKLIIAAFKPTADKIVKKNSFAEKSKIFNRIFKRLNLSTRLEGDYNV